MADISEGFVAFAFAVGVVWCGVRVGGEGVWGLLGGGACWGGFAAASLMAGMPVLAYHHGDSLACVSAMDGPAGMGGSVVARLWGRIFLVWGTESSGSRGWLCSTAHSILIAASCPPAWPSRQRPRRRACWTSAAAQVSSLSSWPSVGSVWSVSILPRLRSTWPGANPAMHKSSGYARTRPHFPPLRVDL